jgi:peptidoglycan/LPS O-acetylase OafA/YrhL
MGSFAPIPIAPALAYGSYGVAFFFVLSGFVLTWSTRTPIPPTTFWWRRFARIYPSHIVALFLAIPVFYSLAPDTGQWWVKPFSVGILLLSVFLLQGWSNNPTILFSGNPAAWTLSCEAFFYALHPAFIRIFGKVARRGAFVTIACVTIVMFAYRAGLWMWPHSWLAGWPVPVVRLSEFAIGIGIALAMTAGWRTRIKPIYCYVGFAALLAFVLYAPGRLDGFAPVRIFLHFTNEWIIVAFAVTIASVASRDVQGARSLLRSRIFVRLGEWSYAFYLIHATIIYGMREVLGVRPPSWKNLLWYGVVLGLSLAASALLHYLVERPFEKQMRRWWNARTSRRRARGGAVASPREESRPRINAVPEETGA